MEKFFAAVRNMFNVPDLRRRILFTLGMLAVYRLGAHIGAPGINQTRLAEVWRDVAGTLLGVLDLFSGGNFRTISVFALGVTPSAKTEITRKLPPEKRSSTPSRLPETLLQTSFSFTGSTPGAERCAPRR